jgi:hypothetical protein
MKMKWPTYIVVGLLLFSGLTIASSGRQVSSREATIALHFNVLKTSEVTVDSETYCLLDVDGADTSLYTAGEPIIPVVLTKLEFPLGTVITSVEIVPSAVQTILLPHPVQPAPQPVVLDGEPSMAQYNVDTEVYASTEYLPGSWFDFSTGGGLDATMEHAMFLNIRTFPARYSPATNTVQYMQEAQVTISYQQPEQAMAFGDDYDLLIIAPKSFTSEVNRLIEAKTSHNIRTKFTTLEDIYANYTGYDKPEQIKYCIKDSIENSGITYVLLVGGYKGYIFGNGGRDDQNQGVKNWYVPVRYTNLNEGGDVYDPGYISDLYYADIYNATGAFQTWDPNGDHIYAKWSGSGKDKLDLYPDVALGRLTCRNTRELKILIDKIITYEDTAADPSWFNRIVLIAGDSHDDTSMDDINEGEVTTDFIFNESMDGFTPVRVYASNRNITDDMTPSPTNIAREATKGCGFLFFEGHGNPTGWNTHWHDVFNWQDSPGGFKIYQMWKLRNKDKYPVCIVGGCHNSMFNISLQFSLTKGSTFSWCYPLPCPRSWSEWITAKKNGGAIACLGNTGLGVGYLGTIGGQPACYMGLAGYIERTFFQAYKADSGKILGNAWSGAISRYLDTWPGMNDQLDCKTVQEWPLIGDPTLKIGGYSSS